MQPMQRIIWFWWNRRYGAKAVLAIALPLLVSTASWTIMNFMDRLFLLKHSREEFAAAMPAGMLQFTLLSFALGIASYANSFVSQYNGAKQYKKIGPAVMQAVLFGFVVTPLFLLEIPLAHTIFADWAKHPAEMVPHEATYFSVLSFGAGAGILAGAMSAFFTGLGRTRVVMCVMVFTSLMNILLDWLWIFGRWGFPEMGIEGAAWATVLSQWARVLIYWAMMLSAKNRAKYGTTFIPKLHLSTMRRLLRHGIPNGLQMLLECSAISVFLMLIGQLGTVDMAATTLAFNVNSVAFVPMLGMGIAVSTMVGHALGANNPRMATRATWSALQLTFLYAGTLAIMYVTVPDLFMMGHANGLNPADFATLREPTIILLRFVAAYTLFDAMNIIFVSAIKGAGDTLFILLVSAVVSPLPVIIGYIGIHYFDGGLIYCWWVITLWICLLGIIYFVRFQQGKWKTMRVIEDSIPDKEITQDAMEAFSEENADSTDQAKTPLPAYGSTD